MSWPTFWTYYAFLMAGMLVCRCAPMFLLKGRTLSERTERVLSLIPSAAFAALVANDLFSPDMFSGGLLAGAVPLAAAAAVFAVARMSRSLVASALTGILAYAALTMLV